LYCQELGEIINIIPFVLSGAWRDNKYYSICIVRSLERYLLSLQAPDHTHGIIFIISPSS
jgi:hypothetical protein